jgi:hypothetical protein
MLHILALLVAHHSRGECVMNDRCQVDEQSLSAIRSGSVREETCGNRRELLSRTGRSFVAEWSTERLAVISRTATALRDSVGRFACSPAQAVLPGSNSRPALAFNSGERVRNFRFRCSIASRGAFAPLSVARRHVRRDQASGRLPGRFPMDLSIFPDTAARSPVIDGPCGCHPP